MAQGRNFPATPERFRPSGDTVIGDDAQDELSAGIDQPDQHEAAQASIDVLLNHPDIARLIDAAVASRVAAMGLPVPAQDAGTGAVVAAIEKLVHMTAVQQPGYMKPLPSGEIERRTNGFVEMRALLDGFREGGNPNNKPRYELVGEPLFAGEIEYPAGSTISTWLFPNEHMNPLNEAARLVHAQMMQWIGGPSIGIAERVAAAEAERRQRQVPESGPFAAPGLPDHSPVDMIAPPPEQPRDNQRRAAHQVPQAYNI